MTGPEGTGARPWRSSVFYNLPTTIGARYDTINVTLPGFPSPRGPRLAKLTWLAGQG
jgi:hypothetical protein